MSLISRITASGWTLVATQRLGCQDSAWVWECDNREAGVIIAMRENGRIRTMQKRVGPVGAGGFDLYARLTFEQPCPRAQEATQAGIGGPSGKTTTNYDRLLVEAPTRR
jgi:hypothetical protein